MLAAAGIVAFALFFEGLGNLFYLLVHGDVFYRRMQASSGQRAFDPFGAGSVRPLIHPYFGFVYVVRPGAEAGHLVANNHLFLQDADYVRRHPGCCDFPVHSRDQDELIIAFTGASVAAGTAEVAQHDDYLPRLLQQVPRFASKRIRVLNFAAGGYKQPQQLMVLAYYLSIGQRFDAVVNIDGYNEATSGATNVLRGAPASFPTDAQLGPLIAFLDGQAGRPNAEGHLFAYHEIAAREWTNGADGCRTASCFLLWRAVAAWHGLMATWSRPGPVDAAQSYFARYPAEAGQPFELAADQWASSVAVMARLAKAQSIPFVTVLQPNQWFRAKLPYVPHTTDAAAQQSAREVPTGYRSLLARIPRLKENGVAVLDATAIFDDYDSDIYSDDCCHYSPEGYRILIKAIADRLEHSPDLGAR